MELGRRHLRTRPAPESEEQLQTLSPSMSSSFAPRQRRRDNEGVARLPATAREAGLGVDTPTQVDLMPCSVHALLEYLAVAPPRAAFHVKTYQNTTVAVDIDDRAAADAVKRELHELGAVVDELCSEFHTAAAGVLAECRQNGQQLLALVKQMSVPSAQGSEEGVQFRFQALRRTFGRQKNDDSGDKPFHNSIAPRRRRKTQRAMERKVRQEITDVLAEAEDKFTAYTAELEIQRAMAQQMLADAVASHDPTTWRQAYRGLFYMAFATVAARKAHGDGHGHEPATDEDDWNRIDIRKRTAALTTSLDTKVREGLPEGLTCFGRLTADLCWELLKGPNGIGTSIARLWPDNDEFYGTRLCSPGHPLLKHCRVDDELLDFATGLEQIVYESPGKLVREDPARELQREQKLALPVEIRKRVDFFAELPQAACVLIYRFVITDGMLLDGCTSHAFDTRQGLEQHEKLYEIERHSSNVNMIVFAHKVLRRVCRQFRDLVADDDVVRTAAAVEITRDDSHQKYLPGGTADRYFGHRQGVTLPAGPLALSGCLRNLRTAASLDLNQVFYGRDGSWEPAMLELQRCCNLRVLRIHQRALDFVLVKCHQLQVLEDRSLVVEPAVPLSESTTFRSVFSSLRQLEVLQLHGISLRNGVATAIAEHCTKLRHLSLGATEHVSLDLQSDWARLLQLARADRPHADAGLAPMRDMTSLQTLCIHNRAGLSDNGLAFLLSGSVGRSLSRLEVRYGNMLPGAGDWLEDDSGLLQVLGCCLEAIVDNCPNLMVLEMQPNDIAAPETAECRFPPSAIDKLCTLKHLKLVRLTAPSTDMDASHTSHTGWGSAFEWESADGCFDRASYVQPLERLLRADHIKQILQEEAAAALSVAEPVCIFALFQRSELCEQKYKDALSTVGTFLTYWSIPEHGNCPKSAADLDAYARSIIIALPHRAGSQYSESEWRHRIEASGYLNDRSGFSHSVPYPAELKSLNSQAGVAVLDFWTIAPLLQMHLPREHEFHLLWLLSTYPIGYDRSDRAQSIGRPEEQKARLVVPSAWTVAQLQRCSDFVVTLVDISTRVCEDKMDVVAKVLAEHLLQACVDAVRWIFEVFVASEFKSIVENAKGSAVECDPNDAQEVALIQEIQADYAEVCVMYPELDKARREEGDQQAAAVLCTRAVAKIQRRTLGAQICSKRQLEKLGSMINDPDAYGYFNTDLVTDIFNLILTVLRDESATVVAHEQITAFLAVDPVSQARVSTEQAGMFRSCFGRLDNANQEVAIAKDHRGDGKPNFVETILRAACNAMEGGQLTSEAVDWLALLASKGISTCRRVWLSDPEAEVYEAVRRQLVQPHNVKLLVQIAAACHVFPDHVRGYVNALSGNPVPEAFTLFPCWLYCRDSAHSRCKPIDAKTARMILETRWPDDREREPWHPQAILHSGCKDAMVLAGLVAWLPRDVVQEHSLKQHRDAILTAVRNWCEDFPTTNAIRAEILPGSAMSVAAKSRRPRNGLELCARGCPRRGEWDSTFSSAIPDAMLLSLCVGLTASCAPGPSQEEYIDPYDPCGERTRVRWQTPTETQQLVNLIFGRMRCLSCNFATGFYGSFWKPSIAEQDFERMQEHAEKTLMKDFAKMVENDLKGLDLTT